MNEAMKENIKDFGKVYGVMIAIMLIFSGAAAMGGQANGAAACAGIATIFFAMYAATIVTTAMIELVAAVKR